MFEYICILVITSIFISISSYWYRKIKYLERRIEVEEIKSELLFRELNLIKFKLKNNNCF